MVLALVASFLMSSCVSMKFKLSDYTDPLEENTLSGSGRDQVVVIPVKGFITDEAEDGMMRRKPSLVTEVVSHIHKAANDPSVKAVVLKVNSPGGTATGSDILYHEIQKLKQSRNMPIVVSMMGVAASGGYYISLPADHIVAHQTTITGSVGVVFIRPKLMGLMDKIGVEIETSKSGKDKDMGSPFRPTTNTEVESFQTITNELAGLFQSRVRNHRHLKPSALSEVTTGKVFTASQALRLGLVDEIGFTDDAIARAKTLAGLDPDARVVMYRRIEYANDNIYNNVTASSQSGSRLLDMGPLNAISDIKPGFYYAWPAAVQ